MVGPVPDDWSVSPADAGAREVVPGLWRLRLPLPWEGIPHVNAFAMGHPDGGAILVDCGCAGHDSHWDSLAAALAEAGYGIADIRQVVLTHYHSDHAGLMARLIEESGCEVLGHPAIEHFTDGHVRPGEVEAARARRARAEGVPPAFVPACADVGEEVHGIIAAVPPAPSHDGDTIESALGPWTVLDTPGHAPSHVCLHQPEAGLLIVGDLIGPGFHPYFDYGYTSDPVAEYFSSLERIDALAGVTLLLPGHGRPLPDLHATVVEWRNGLRAHVDAVEAAVADGAANAWEVTERIYHVQEPDMALVMSIGETVAYLRHLRRTGRIVRRTAADGSFRYSAA